MTRKARDLVAGLGLGHLGIDGQVQEAVEEQPAVHIQERGEAAAAGGRERSPGTVRRGDCPRSARVHLRRWGHGPRRGRRRAAMATPPAFPGQGQLPLRGNNPAAEIQTPRFLLAFLSSRPQRCLLRPLQHSAPLHSWGEARQPSAIRSFSSSSSSGLIAPVFFHGGGEGELPLDLVFSPRQICPPPACTHHPRSCSPPRLPLLLCSPSARGTHAGGSEEERGRRGPPPSSRHSIRWEVKAAGPRGRYGIPHRRSGAGGLVGRRSSYLLSLQGKEAGGRWERRVNSPSVSQLTASKQPFLKANCHLFPQPPARSLWRPPPLGPFGSVPPPVPQWRVEGGRASSLLKVQPRYQRHRELRSRARRSRPFPVLQQTHLPQLKNNSKGGGGDETGTGAEVPAAQSRQSLYVPAGAGVMRPGSGKRGGASSHRAVAAMSPGPSPWSFPLRGGRAAPAFASGPEKLRRFSLNSRRVTLGEVLQLVRSSLPSCQLSFTPSSHLRSRPCRLLTAWWEATKVPSFCTAPRCKRSHCNKIV